jgi:hypothetical protein
MERRASSSTSVVARRAGHVERLAEPSTEDVVDERQGLGADGGADAVVGAAGAAVVDVEGDQLDVVAVALEAPIGDGSEPSRASTLKKNPGTTSGPLCPARARRAPRSIR